MTFSPKIILSSLLLVAVAVSVPASAEIPKPLTVQLNGLWQLEIELRGTPQPIEVVLPGDDEPTRFWYQIYTLTNNTGKDVYFYPQFDLFTDTFKLYHVGEKARKPVFNVIQKLYTDKFPLLESQEHITGRILQGGDNARDSVAIFEDFDQRATKVKIFIAGLSNEVVAVPYPTVTDSSLQQEKPKEFLLRKTLMLQYQVPGDRFNPQNKVMLFRDQQWLMR
ncbi:MAG: hypothetical protein K9M57_09755 [Phycisphaerae bacterium]|nr:hypothetical protein [Phycisphaerae bacterium]